MKSVVDLMIFFVNLFYSLTNYLVNLGQRLGLGPVVKFIIFKSIVMCFAWVFAIQIYFLVYYLLIPEMHQEQQLYFQQSPYTENYFAVFFTENNGKKYQQNGSNGGSSRSGYSYKGCDITDNVVYKDYGLTLDTICDLHLHNQKNQVVFEPEYYKVEMNLELFNKKNEINSQLQRYSNDNSYFLITTHLIYGNGKHVTTKKIWHENLNYTKRPMYVRFFYAIMRRILNLIEIDVDEQLTSVSDTLYQKLPNNILDIRGVIIDIEQQDYFLNPNHRHSFHEFNEDDIMRQYQQNKLAEERQQQQRAGKFENTFYQQQVYNDQRRGGHQQQQQQQQQQNQNYNQFQQQQYQQQQQHYDRNIMDYKNGQQIFDSRDDDKILINKGELIFKPYLYGIRYYMYYWFYTCSFVAITCLTVYLFFLYYFLKVMFQIVQYVLKLDQAQNKKKGKNGRRKKKTQSPGQVDLLDEDEDLLFVRAQQQKKNLFNQN